MTPSEKTIPMRASAPRLPPEARMGIVFSEGDPHARFRAEVAAGHVLEVLAAKLQLKRGRELVGRRRRDAVVHESVPERRLVLGVLEGGIGVVTKAPRCLVVLGGEAGVVVERLGVDREPLRARLGDRLHALPGRAWRVEKAPA